MTDTTMRWVGKDDTGAAAASVKRNIESVGKAASGAQGGVKGLTDAMDKMAPAGKSAQGALTGMESAAKGLLGGLGGVAAAMGVGALVGFGGQMIGAAVDMGKAAEASDRLRSAMDGLAAQAGTSGSEIISRLQQASGGAIAEYDLMLSANKAMMLGVASNAEDMGKLMEIARTRGTAMGLSVTQAFDNLVTGLGRGSALILDNLGIMVDADATNKAYAESVGKTVEQLSEQEKKQALVNRTLQEATGAALPAASAYERMGASWANLKISMGDLFSPMVTGVLEGMTSLADGAIAVENKVSKAFTTTDDEERQALFQATREAVKFFNDDLQMTQKTADDYVLRLRAAYADAQRLYELGATATIAPVTGADLGLSDEEFTAISAMEKAYDAQQRLNQLYGDAVALQRDQERASWAVAVALEAQKAAQAETERNEKLQAALKGQYAGVADIQAFYAAEMEVKAAAEKAGLSALQTSTLLAQMSAQYGVLTSSSMTSSGALYNSADAIKLVTDNAQTAVDALAALPVALTAQETAAAALNAQYANVAPMQAFYGAQMQVAAAAREHGATEEQVAAILGQMHAQYDVLTSSSITLAGSGYDLATALQMVFSGGMGAAQGITAAGEAANHAQSGFYGLVTAAQAASVAMRQALVDSAQSRVQSAYLSAAGTIGADKAYAGYKDAESSIASAAHMLQTFGVSTEEAKFRLEAMTQGIAQNVQNQAGLIQAHEQARLKAWQAASGLGGVAHEGGGAAGKLGGLAEKAGDLSGKFQGLLDKIPGLKGTSEVTDKQLSDAKLGIPQNFADDYLRRLTDEVLNGVDWQGVDIGDAAQRAGIDPSLPAQTILAMFKNAWADSSLFANPANLDLINMDAVKQGLTQANNAQAGKANIDALFGIGDDATIAAVAGIGLKVQQGLSQWLTDNGMADAGAKLAAAIGAGVTTTGIPLDGGLHTWQGSDAAKSAADAVSSWLGIYMSEHTVITPTVNMPVIPGAPTTPTTTPTTPTAPTAPSVPFFASGTTYFGGGWAQVHRDEVVHLAAGPVYNARQARGVAPASVVVNAVINNKLDEAQFAQMLRSAMRKAQVRS